MPQAGRPRWPRASTSSSRCPWTSWRSRSASSSAPIPQSCIDWLDYGTDYILAKHPDVRSTSKNHVGNYPDLWVPYDGQTIFFYHLPQYCDERLGQDVHTLSIFDLYRDWATYAHPNFYLQHDYILQEIATAARDVLPRVGVLDQRGHRRAAVPARDRVLALERHPHAGAELTDDGLPPLEGHVEFMTGHEWDYWMTDYLTAKMLWQATEPLDTFVDHYTAAYGNCSADVDPR